MSLPALTRAPPAVGLLLALLAASALPPGLGAQENRGPSLGPQGEVGARVGIHGGFGSLRGTVSGQLGGSALLDLTRWLRAGGEGTIFLSSLSLSREDSEDRSELSFGYGGIYLEMTRRLPEDDPWSLGLLLGAGAARVRSIPSGAPLDTGNFLLLEPSLQREIRRHGPLHAVVGASYRFPIQAPTLVGVRPSDLRGGSIRISLHLVRSP